MANRRDDIFVEGDTAPRSGIYFEGTPVRGGWLIHRFVDFEKGDTFPELASPNCWLPHTTEAKQRERGWTWAEEHWKRRYEAREKGAARAARARRSRLRHERERLAGKSGHRDSEE